MKNAAPRQKEQRSKNIRMTNIEINSFDYTAEEAKKSFDANIGSLHEVSMLIRSKITAAQANDKQGIFFTLQDAGIIRDWLDSATVSLRAEYNTISRVNRKAMKLYHGGCAIEQRCTCRHLIEADKFLTKWEEYKSSKITALIKMPE